MKHLSLISAVSLAALALMSCNKETTQGTDPDSGTKAITVTINGAALTKASPDPQNPYATNSDALSTIDLYFTSRTGSIIASRRVSKAGETENEWNNLTKSDAGVRYINLNGVEAVYVVANSSGEILEEGENVKDIVLNLENFGGDKEQAEIVYAGGTDNLITGDEPIEGVTVTINMNVGQSTSDEDNYTGDLYALAKIAIRPVISRLEISKISVVTKGEESDITIESAPNRTFKVEWDGFNPSLYGIYMSNVYGSWAPFPATGVPAESFPTPSGQDAISEGKWASAPEDINKQYVTLYSNYESDYQPLFSSPSTEGDKTVLFNGSTQCIPFNFLASYDVTATSENAETELKMDLTPHFHFQFNIPADYSFNIFETSDDGNTPISPDGDDSAIYYEIADRFMISQTVSGMVYANVTGFTETEGGNVEIHPSTIYRMSEIVINPYNISGSTVYDPNAKTNIVVSVTVIPFDAVNVTPVFDKN